MLIFILAILVTGAIVGGIARLLVPGRDPIGCLGTIVLGVLGSIVGGFIENLILYHRLTHNLRPVGFIGAVLGAILLLVLFRLSGLEPGHRRR